MWEWELWVWFYVRDRREGLQWVHNRGNQFKFRQRAGQRNTKENTLISRDFQESTVMTWPTHAAGSILFGVRAHDADIHRCFLLCAPKELWTHMCWLIYLSAFFVYGQLEKSDMKTNNFSEAILIFSVFLISASIILGSLFFNISLFKCAIFLF